MFDNDKSDEGQKVPGIPGSYGHEQRRRQRRVRNAGSSREAQKAGRDATRARSDAATAAEQTSRLPQSGGPTFTGGGSDSPLGKVDLRKQTQTVMRRIKWTLRAGTIGAIALVALGLALGEGDSDSGSTSNPVVRGASSYIGSGDERSFFRADRLRAMLDATEAKLPESATLTELSCYASNCHGQAQAGDTTQTFQVSQDLTVKVRRYSFDSDRGLPFASIDEDAPERALETIEADYDLATDEVLRISLSSGQARSQYPRGWTLVYYVDGKRNAYAAELDGAGVTRRPDET